MIEAKLMEGSIQRISTNTIIADSVEYDPSEVRALAYKVLYRHVDDHFISISATAPPLYEESTCGGCEQYTNGPHTHARAYFDIDVELLRIDLDAFCKRILEPFEK